jgi:hypothetical protein
MAWPFAYESTIQTCAEYDSAGLAASGVISVLPVRLYMLYGFNGNVAAQYIQVFNTVAVPANAVVPALPPILVPALASFMLDLGFLGSVFTVGLCWSNSSTGSTKTIGAADCWIHALFR